MRTGLEAQAARRAARLAAGEDRVGWKVALNDQRVQRALGIDAPTIGYLTSATTIASGGTHSLAGATRAAVEPEVAVHIGEGGEVEALGAALEVIDVDMPFEDVTAILERNVFHRAAVLGPAATGVTELEGLMATLRLNGAEEEIDVAASALAPAETIELVAGHLEAIGEGLRPGDVIIAGSLITALRLEGDATVELEIDRLGSVAVEIRSA